MNLDEFGEKLERWRGRGSGAVAVSGPAFGDHAGGLPDYGLSQGWLAGQAHQAHEVVRGGHQIAREVDAFQATVACLAKATHRFQCARSSLGRGNEM